MEAVDPAKVTRKLQREFDESLRSVTVYDQDGYEIQYIRSDVDEEYDDETKDKIAEEIRMETLQSDYLRNIYSSVHGEFKSSARIFAEGIEFNFPLSNTEGIAIAVDRVSTDNQKLLAARIQDILTECQA